MAAFIVELACTNSVLEDTINAKESTQDDAALVYAMAIASTWPTDWPRANNAILARWPKGLERVKKKAWRLIEKRKAEIQKEIDEGKAQK